MDITKTINRLVGKITKDDSLMASFKKNAKATVKKLIKSELSDETLDKIVTAVKAKVMGDKARDVAEKLTGLFKGK